MSTYGELQTSVRTRLIDAPSAVVTEVPVLVNRAVKAIQQQHDFLVMKRRIAAQVTVLDTHALVARPANWKKPRARPVLTYATGHTRELDWADDQSDLVGVYGELVDVFDEGRPQWLIFGDPSDDSGALDIEVWPLPDGLSDWNDGEYRITIPYYGYLTPLSAAGDTNWFTENAEEYIINRASAQGFAVDWDDGGEAKWQAKTNSELQRIIALDKNERVASVQGLDFWLGPRGPLARY